MIRLIHLKAARAHNRWVAIIIKISIGCLMMRVEFDGFDAVLTRY